MDWWRDIRVLVRAVFTRRVASDFDSVRSMPLVAAAASGLLAVGLWQSWQPTLPEVNRVFAPQVWLAIAAVGVPAGLLAWWRGPAASFLEATAPGFLLMCYGFGRALAFATGENTSVRPWAATAVNLVIGGVFFWLWLTYYLPTHHAHHAHGRRQGRAQPWTRSRS